jgi:agmatinase
MTTALPLTFEDVGPWLPRASRFLGLEDAQADPQRSRCVILPVPFERTSSYGRGSHAGPGAILAASQQVELRDADLDTEPWTLFDGIVTRSALDTRHVRNGEALMHALHTTVGEYLDQGRMVVTLGGEHTSIVGAARAYASRHDDLTILQLDAHSDLRPSYNDDRWNHACTMARICEFNPAVVQVGIRSESADDLPLVQKHGIAVFHGERLQRDALAGADWIEPIVNACGQRVYITLDCDVLDPTVMPATGTPEPGGLTWMQITMLLARLCAQRTVVGFDVSELAPLQHLHAPQFIVAKLIYRLIGLIGASHA